MSLPFAWRWIAVLAVALSVLRTLTGGQDLNFDLVTYHDYLGHTAFADRTALDFLPAGFQGYQSPLPYAAFAWLDEHGVPPWINAMLHASVHAVNLIALLFLSRLLIGTPTGRDSRFALISLWLLGAVTPAYWQLVGTSFADLPTSALVLCALWLIAVRVRTDTTQRRTTWMLAGGALLVGLAAGMRWHNAIYVVALACATGVARFERAGEKWRALGILIAFSAAGFLAGFLPWAWRNFSEFGSPVFPFFNGWFRSPDFFAANLPLTTFKPESLAGWITFPFRMASFDHWVYFETRLPDVRPVLLALAALALVIVLAWRRFIGGPRSPEPGSPARRFILVFFAVGVALWLATSCNGRYGVALLLLAGPVCGVLLLRLLPVRYVALIAAGVVAWQAALQQASFALPRWTSGPWTGRNFDWVIPESMSRAPAVLLTFGYQTASTLVPRLHPRSRHVNLVGQLSIPPDGPGSERVKRIIDTPGGRIYGIFDFYYTQQSDPAAHSIKQYFGEYLPMWGLEFAPGLCRLITLRRPSAEWDWLNRWVAWPYGGNPPEYIACELRRADPTRQLAALERLRDFRARLASLGTACPGYFAVPVSLMRHPGQWIVTSFGSLEFRIEFDDDGVVVLQQTRPPYSGVVLGRQTDPDVLPGGIACGRWPAVLAQAARSDAR